MTGVGTKCIGCEDDHLGRWDVTSLRARWDVMIHTIFLYLLIYQIYISFSFGYTLKMIGTLSKTFLLTQFFC